MTESRSYADSTKHALILVSKLWWTLTIDLLYEEIWILSPLKLSGSVNALERNLSCAASTATYVRHISLYLHDFCGDEDEAKGFERLFTICEKIQTVKLCSTQNWHIAVITPRPDALKDLRVEWDDNEPGYTTPLIKSLDGSFNVHTLQISFLNLGTGPNGPNLPRSLSFPSLHTLGLLFIWSEYCDQVIDITATWELASILFAKLDLAEYQQRKPLEKFFTEHGPKLTSIQIDNISVPILLLIAEHCSMLEDLIVLYYQPQDHCDHFDAAFPQLRQIRIEQDTHFSALGQFLERIFSAQRPLLRKIQVCTFGDNFLSDWDVNGAKKMVDDWGKENVRLEDGNGQLLDVSVEALINNEFGGKVHILIRT
jgi:hypothetical protein